MTAARALMRLARLLGVQTSYVDAGGTRRHAPRDALVATLQALGAELTRPGDAPGALGALERTAATRALEPVCVAWDGRLRTLRVRLPVGDMPNGLRVRVREESGRTHVADRRPADLPVVATEVLDGRQTVVLEWRLALALEPGRHRLTLEAGAARHEATVIGAPRRAASGAGPAHAWGVFAPAYALRSERNLGVGDLGDLEALVEWTRGLGGATVATLPLSATFLDTPYEPSPYRPDSRRLWSELYVDVERLPEANDAPAVRALLDSAEIRASAAALRAGRDVDYRGAMALKRRILAAAAAAVEQAPPARRAAFEAYRMAHPHVASYARFRAHVTATGGDWRSWTGPPPADAEAERRHAYAQWAMDEQLAAIGGAGAPALYLDLPLGVHPDGYDAWHEGTLFVHGLDTGAPPDAFQADGQTWGLPPPDPRILRARGHDYVAECLRHQMRYARYLRIDHVMGLHRLFVVPHGFSARDGVYVRYPADELWAVVCAESVRANCVVVGEDLGTVPGEVRTSMRRHGVRGMFVQRFELPRDRTPPLPTADQVASLGTHDLPPFAAYWDGSDLEERMRHGLVSPDTLEWERERRAQEHAVLRRALAAAGVGDDPEVTSVLRHALLRLAASATPLLVVALEDVWLERRSQNVPGTPATDGNWVHTLARTMDELRTSSDVRDLLAAIAAARAS